MNHSCVNVSLADGIKCRPNLHEGGGMRNQRPKAAKLANSRKEKTSS